MLAAGTDSFCFDTQRQTPTAITAAITENDDGYLLGELRSMGLECFEPQGAFYMFPSIESTGLSSDEFCERLLHEQEVAVIPGSAFGESGEGHVRISYSYSMNHLREACSRIRKFLQTL